MVLVWLGIRLKTRGHGRLSSCLTGLTLAAGWAWTGAIFHFQYFATINFVASFYGALFLAQAILLAWAGVAGDRLALRGPYGAAGRLGLCLIVLAIVAYPAFAVIAGDGVASARVVGLEPGPTAVFTLGVLLLADERTPLHLAIVPVLWTLIAGATAWELGMAEEAILPFLGLGVSGLMLARKRHRHPASRHDDAGEAERRS